MHPSILLSIECASESASVALHRDGHAPSIVTGPGGAAVSAGLLPMIASLLQAAGIPRQAFDAIAFGAGPGAFMGVRTAASIAQGLAVGRDLPVQPVGTLEALAWRASERGQRPGRYAVVVDARMSELYHAIYQSGPAGEWIEIAAPAVGPVGSAVATWREADLDDTAVLVGAPALIDPPASMRALALRIDASMVAEFALDHWHGADAAAALPLYVRDRVASTLAERALAAAG